MKFLKSLLGKNKDKDETPTWEIRPPSERPPSRRGRSLSVANTGAEATPKTVKKDPHPFMDDPMLDTMTLEVDLSSNEDDPYSTHSWAKGLENETRKLKTIQIGEKTEKKISDSFNPYDTGKMRRSWKK